VALIITARRFFITSAYNEWDAADLSGHGLFLKMLKGLGLERKGCKTVRGERAY